MHCARQMPQSTTFATMESKRQQKVGRLLQKELANIFQREDSLKFKGVFITVTMVRMTTDLGVARVYLSIFPSTNAKDVLVAIRESGHEVRHKLGNALRHSLRRIPELEFFIDDSLDYAERIDELLKT